MIHTDIALVVLRHLKDYRSADTPYSLMLALDDLLHVLGDPGIAAHNEEVAEYWKSQGCPGTAFDCTKDASLRRLEIFVDKPEDERLAGPTF